jgi:hypothetical protein
MVCEKTSCVVDGLTRLEVLSSLTVMWGRTYRRRCDVRRATERAAREQEEATTSG